MEGGFKLAGPACFVSKGFPFRYPQTFLANPLTFQLFSSLVCATGQSGDGRKNLPDAFLRRCIYYNISFPNENAIEEIVIRRLPELIPPNDRAAALSREAIDFVLYCRRDAIVLDKQPGTAEILNWLSAMLKLGADPSLPLKRQTGIASRAFPALVKISEDQARITGLLQSWSDER